MSARAVPRLTPEEFLAAERAAEFRSEYVNGEVFAMSGGTDVHCMLATSMTHILMGSLEDGPCNVFGGNLMVEIAAGLAYCFPDVMAVCGAREHSQGRKDIITNPVLIVEVLSPSTESWDRGGKFDLYRMIDTLKEYVLISQEKMSVEWFTKRDNGEWTFRVAKGPEAMARLESVNVDVPLARLYKKVELLP
jgi:Uma2 family endonuclease